MCLAIAAVNNADVLAAALEELSRRDDPESALFVVDVRMGTFIVALTKHESSRVREAALELIAKRKLHFLIEAAYEALLRPESDAIWSTAAYAISQCPDTLDRDKAETLLRHTDTVLFRLRHLGCPSAYDVTRARLQDAHNALLRAGTGAK
jgi:hypothetical protein